MQEILLSTNQLSVRHGVDERRLTRFARFAWGTLVYNVLVVLWGAFVRASYSGDGCGSHWPLCNGEIVPAAVELKTLVEYSHRLTSGLALVLVVLLVAWARKLFPPKHNVRRASLWALFFTITEALIGAGLVVYGLVANDDSIARAISLAVHLVNTFLLLAALSFAAAWAASSRDEFKSSGALKNFRLHLSHNSLTWTFGAAIVCMLLLGTSGAIAALGDTLFPVKTLAEGFQQDASATAHALIRWRLLHPVSAVIATLILVLTARAAVRSAPGDVRVRRWSLLLIGILTAQMIAGGVNVLLLAPVWMQILHLLLADALWIALVLLGVRVFAGEPLAMPAGVAARLNRAGFNLRGARTEAS